MKLETPPKAGKHYVADRTPHVRGAAAMQRDAREGIGHRQPKELLPKGISMREIGQVRGDSEKTVEKVFATFSPDYQRQATGALQLAGPTEKSALQVKGRLSKAVPFRASNP